MSHVVSKKNIIYRWINHSSDLGGAIAAFCLLALAVLISYDVCLRYFFGRATTWVQESSVYLCMAVGLLASAYALKTDSHFSVTLLVDRLGPSAQRKLKLLTNTVGFLYSLSFVLKGYEMAVFSYEMEDVSTGLMQFPLWISTGLIPVGGALLALQFLNKLYDAATANGDASSLSAEKN